MVNESSSELKKNVEKYLSRLAVICLGRVAVAKSATLSLSRGRFVVAIRSKRPFGVQMCIYLFASERVMVSRPRETRV